MNKQQTAVEWLVEQFENHRATFFKLNDKEERVITLAGRDVIKQAKEMEKEQMIDFGAKCLQSQNETYGGNK
jgi:queuine/archaeosine tRNA-ribosyltransferase